MRDFQQRRVYDAESRFELLVSVERPDLAALSRFNVTDGSGALDEIHRILLAGGVDSRPCTDLRHDYRGGGLARGRYRIQVGKTTSWWVLAHEQCHLAVDSHYPAHGVEFAQALLVVADHLGVGEQLRQAFIYHKVAYDYEARAPKIRAHARWLLRPNADTHRVHLVTRLDASLGSMRLMGHAERGPYGVTFTQRIDAAGKPITVPYHQIAYVEEL